MSFKTNQNQQLTLDDRFINQSSRTKKIIMNSWCKDFADTVFPAINEERFSVLYSDNKFSRPNTPVNFIIGALILKENSNLNDDELIESICCDLRYQYALHTTHLPEQPVSDRTFSRFRERLYNYELETGKNLLEEEMMYLSKVFSDYMNLNSNVKRMDSLMISSRCKRMSRLEIIYSTTANAVKLIHRLGNDELIPKELLHYLDSDDYNNVVYYCKGDDVTPRLEKTILEAAKVKTIMDDDAWHEFQEYRLLIRVLKEQSSIDESGNPAAKDKEEISSSSLQNPSDPDATYRKKAGKDHKGYVGNIVETVGENGDSLITSVGYEGNTHSDSTFCKEYLESRPDDAEPETLIADGAYSGSENKELAASKNTELITTALSGKETSKFYAGFTFTEDGQHITSCPMGNAPIKTTLYPQTGICRALFAKECCEKCPYRKECISREQKNNYAIHVSANMVERAKYLAKLTTDEYRQLTRIRNAIEGIPSVLRRKYHIDDIPVFGHLRSRQFFLLKVGAYNFNKLLKHNRRKRDKSAQNLVMA
ncbi:MAG: transposase [Lachnospiraceae bacterium]